MLLVLDGLSGGKAGQGIAQKDVAQRSRSGSESVDDADENDGERNRNAPVLNGVGAKDEIKRAGMRGTCRVMRHSRDERAMKRGKVVMLRGICE
jgi:hypothetical protein